MIETPIVALVTDFGNRDSYVFEIVSVLRSYKVDVKIEVVSNAVSAGNVSDGAFVIGRVRDSLKPGDILIGVVDPGVGSSRRAVAIKQNDCYFIGPDNGLFKYVITSDNSRIVEIDPEKVSPTPIRFSTFHGRDIFAHAAGKLLNGWTIDQLGYESELIKTQIPRRPLEAGGKIFGSVIYIDSFGNAITNITTLGRGVVELPSGEKVNQYQSYSSIPAGQTGWLVSSDGRIEISRNLDSSARHSGLTTGTGVVFINESRHPEN